MARIDGTSGDDSLVGYSTDDEIYGHAGNDTLIGGILGGDDTLYGGEGDDWLWGGAPVVGGGRVMTCTTVVQGKTV